MKPKFGPNTTTMKYLSGFAFIFALSLLLGCSNVYQDLNTGKKAKNIILLIGDGMGLAQISSIYYFQENTPQFNRFKVIGLHQNEATDEKITDSAAGATAFAVGVKTYNAAIGVDKDTISKTTILEMAALEGKSTGLVATSSITHATPASFFAHVAHRNFHEQIASQLVTSPVRFFAGGGLQFFNKREDGQDLIPKLVAAGFAIDTQQLVRPSSLSINKKYGFLLAPDGMPKMQEGRGNFLPDATQMAIDYLSQDPEGFFLMVEGSQIDWGGHANDSDYIVEEMKDFDKTIKIAMDFAAKDGNTLVIVTADHETGGYALSAGEVRKQANYNIIGPTFSTGGHTASLIPVFAYGPGASNFMGIYQNNEIFDKMISSKK